MHPSSEHRGFFGAPLDVPPEEPPPRLKTLEELIAEAPGLPVVRDPRCELPAGVAGGVAMASFVGDSAYVLSQGGQVTRVGLEVDRCEVVVAERARSIHAAAGTLFVLTREPDDTGTLLEVRGRTLKMRAAWPGSIDWKHLLTDMDGQPVIVERGRIWTERTGLWSPTPTFEGEPTVALGVDGTLFIGTATYRTRRTEDQPSRWVPPTIFRVRIGSDKVPATPLDGDAIEGIEKSSHGCAVVTVDRKACFGLGGSSGSSLSRHLVCADSSWQRNVGDSRVARSGAPPVERCACGYWMSKEPSGKTRLSAR